ncbi:hypothetical protein NC653_039934 [Populus alba x Populus x berolinensis]|uniref:Uncharacterized protein n=1 Tax=Populus alba x Populus x berolinensis TaxID=444605 RepID=A0AAD6LCK4_9ROSI|nr:hypothetical protein NC653_039934 [Populus alba x Populus x berolinensis]
MISSQRQSQKATEITFYVHCEWHCQRDSAI